MDRAPQPRGATTIQGYLRILHAPLTAWSTRYTSLRQVTADDISEGLANLTGATRLLAISAMRSLFGTLKARRLLFANPTAGLIARRPQPAPALALAPSTRSSLLTRAQRPDDRLMLLLTGIHALRTHQICALVLDDIDLSARTLNVEGRPQHLDTLTHAQLRAWLEHRLARWPATASPHLLINRSTAPTTIPVTRGFVHDAFRRLGPTAHDLRVDRLLDEAEASGGDPLRLTHLFGISDPTALRYCAELGPLDNALAETVPASPAS